MKTIVITGASDGLGAHIAKELSSSEYSLILCGRDSQKLETVKAECNKLGANAVETFSFDLTDTTAIHDFVAKLQARSIDGLINNAGIWQKKTQLDQIPEEELLAVVNTNLTGLMILTRTLLPLLRKSNNAFILNVSSRSGYQSQQNLGQSVYSATKYGVRGFTEVLRNDLLDSNIRVAALYQSGVNTQMFNKAGENFPSEKLATFIPPRELARIIAFQISRPLGIWISDIRIESK